MVDGGKRGTLIISEEYMGVVNYKNNKKGLWLFVKAICVKWLSTERLIVQANF